MYSRALINANKVNHKTILAVCKCIMHAPVCQLFCSQHHRLHFVKFSSALSFKNPARNVCLSDILFWLLLWFTSFIRWWTPLKMSMLSYACTTCSWNMHFNLFRFSRWHVCVIPSCHYLSFSRQSWVLIEYLITNSCTHQQCLIPRQLAFSCQPVCLGSDWKVYPDVIQAWFETVGFKSKCQLPTSHAAFGRAVGLSQFGIFPGSFVSVLFAIFRYRNRAPTFNHGVCLMTTPMLLLGEYIGEVLVVGVWIEGVGFGLAICVSRLCNIMHDSVFTYVTEISISLEMEIEQAYFDAKFVRRELVYVLFVWKRHFACHAFKPKFKYQIPWHQDLREAFLWGGLLIIE